ncbi:FAD-binding Berberine family protein [Raphanus sativus]|uniref:Berberine bridge enzyme-like 16 n=1 Tax=Raphanus sativus TaxID=3726 RepID=A0A6J0MRG4_RAPSA|nr:berberine bridge enzyme-like 16 [Raphanus sativus]KAJ4907074.1 FAD-binding Berberine family protein [Raphanus sativus]
MKMKIFSLPTFLISLHLLIFLITFPRVYSSSRTIYVPELFLQCLDTQPADPGSPNSNAAVIPTDSSFSTNLMSAVRNLRFASASTRKPEAIVAAVTETHIRATISCCKLLNLELKVRSGGHDYEGFSYTSPVPFVILDMYNFHKVDINLEDETVWIQSGASLGELYYNIAKTSKVHAFPAGVCPKVGAGGHFSGGGFGNLMRKYGLSVDNIIDAQIMDADGKVYRDRRSMGEDVFWAIRGGGGGSYGVILAWKLKLVRVPENVTVFKLERTVQEGAIDLVYKWQHVAPVIDKDLFIRLEIKPVYRNTSECKTRTINVSFIGMFLGEPKRLLNIMNQSFPELDLKEPDCMVKKWIDSVVFWAEYPENQPLEILLKRISVNEYYWKRTSDFVQTPISKQGIARIFQTMIYHSPLPRRVWMQWNPWGGRMAEIASDETPFVHRAGNVFMIEHFMNWYAPGEKLEEEFMAISRSFKKAMAPFVSKNPREAFLNYRDVDIGITTPGYNATVEGAKVYGEKYFKGNYLRLVQVKAGFDPTNFFRSQQGIPVPA